MTPKNLAPRPKGQALVMIALAIVGLVGFAALAIDGSSVFSDRRHSQNASDTAVLAAALARTRADADWKQVGLDRAAENDYTNDGTAEVDVYVCDEWETLSGEPCKGLPAGADASEYVLVRIKSVVKLFFAPVIGWREVTNRTDAVARSVPSTVKPMFEGNAVVGLAPEQCKAVMYQGNAATTIQGGGIFVNSECNYGAFFNNSGAAKLTAPCLQAVGHIQAKPGILNIPTSCISQGVNAYNYPPDNIVFPNVVCPSGGSKSGNTLSPGTYSGKFPPSGVNFLNSGTYCVSGDFTVNGGDTLIGNGVIIIMLSGNVSFNGGATVKLSGVPGPRTDENPYGGLLMYMPMSNSGTITLNGNSDSAFTGTILAPAADIIVKGTGDAGLYGQLIGYTVDLSGDSATKIVYLEEENWQAQVPPNLQFTK